MPRIDHAARQWKRSAALGRAMLMALSVATLLFGIGGSAAQEDLPIEPQSGIGTELNPRQQFCRRLEQQLNSEWQQGKQVRDQLPQIRVEIQRIDRIYNKLNDQLENSDCYEYFLFTKTLRNSRACLKLSAQVDEGRQRLANLEAQRQSAESAASSRDSSRVDELILALAKNNCGPQYQQEAQKRSTVGKLSTFWEDGEAVPDAGFGIDGDLPPPSFATYRTICVRLCDGYYYPISFQAPQSSLQRDADVCKQQCAAPAELFYYQNPGQEVPQAMSLRGTPYSKLTNAFAYREKFVEGCSCKVTEFQPEKFGTEVAVDEGNVPTGDSVVQFDSVEPQPVEPLIVEAQPKPRKRPKSADKNGLPFKISPDR